MCQRILDLIFLIFVSRDSLREVKVGALFNLWEDEASGQWAKVADNVVNAWNDKEIKIEINLKNVLKFKEISEQKFLIECHIVDQ